MRYILLFSSALIFTNPTYAENIDIKLDTSKVDDQQYCVYKNEIYTLGSTITTEKDQLHCEHVQSASSNYKGNKKGGSAQWN